MANSAQFVATPNVKVNLFTAADTTVKKTIFTAGASGSKVVAIPVVNEDSVQTPSFLMELLINDGSNAGIVNTAPVPTLAGTNGSPPNLMDDLGGTETELFEIDNNGNIVINLKTGHTLEARMKATIEAAKTVYITVLGWDY